MSQYPFGLEGEVKHVKWDKELKQWYVLGFESRHCYFTSDKLTEVEDWFDHQENKERIYKDSLEH